jgi:hypothetical protein
LWTRRIHRTTLLVVFLDRSGWHLGFYI